VLDESDARRLGVVDGGALRLRSEVGEYLGSAKVVRLPAGSLQVHWPEGNVLIGHDSREQHSDIPDYNAVVTVEVL
jgi:hypothetical protein